MPYSLNELKILLRERLGEPTEGTFGSAVTYDTGGGSSETRDELLDFINRGQAKVAEDSISQGHSLLQGRRQIAIEANTYEYALPSDFISVLDLFQYHSTVFYRIAQHPLSGLRNLFNPDSTASIYTHFDVFGVTAEVLSQGVASSSVVSSTTFTDDDGAFDTEGITNDVDVIFNLTDDSSATITGQTAQTLTFSSGLVGGKTNTFQYGDRYQVQRGNETLQVLNMYPSISSGDTQSIISETSSTSTPAAFAGPFTLSDEAVLFSISVYIDSAVTSPLRVEVRNAADATDKEYGGIDTAKVDGYNEAIFEYGFKMSKTASYNIYVTDGDGAAVNFVSTGSFTKVKASGYTGDEYLDLYYARYPKPYDTNFTGVSEIPDYGIEAVILYAEHIALLKMSGGRNNMATQALNDYREEVGRLLMQRGLRSKNRTTVVGNVIGYGMNRVPTIKNVPITTKLPLG